MKSHNNGVQKIQVPPPKTIVLIVFSPMVEIPEHKMPEMVGRNAGTAAAIRSAIINAVVQTGIARSGLMDINSLTWGHIKTIDHIANHVTAHTHAMVRPCRVF